MLRDLPFKTIGDVGRHGLELVYCPNCYATRLVATDDTRWRDRLFAAAVLSLHRPALHRPSVPDPAPRRRGPHSLDCAFVPRA
jgi:hypothetical protein